MLCKLMMAGTTVYVTHILIAMLLVHAYSSSSSVAAASIAMRGDALVLPSPYAADLTAAYTRNESPMDGYTLYWNVSDSHIELAIDARTTGWVGFGVAQPDTSVMALADIVTAHVDTNGVVHVVDRFSTAEVMPEPDCSQDWETISGSQEDGWTAVRLRRLLVTDDAEQDRPIVDNGFPVRVIVAFGSSSTDIFSYHNSNRRGLKLDIFAEVQPEGSIADPLADMRHNTADFFQVELRQSIADYVTIMIGKDGFVNILGVPNVTGVQTADHCEMIGLEDELLVCGGAHTPSCAGGLALPNTEDTVYANSCWNTATLLEGAHFGTDVREGGGVNASARNQSGQKPWHIVGFEGLVDNLLTKKHVHHFVLFGHKNSTSCQDGPGEVLFGWAPGVDAARLPNDAGYPVVHGNVQPDVHGYRSLKLGIHYDNPDFEKSILDDSGIRFFVTRERRTFDAGVFVLGDVRVSLAGTEVPAGPSGLSMVEFTCPSNCTVSLLPEPITVFATGGHMHRTGTAMGTQWLRDGTPVPSATHPAGYYAKYDAYDYAYSQDLNPTMFEIQPGDAFVTKCMYDVNKRRHGKSKVLFGFGSNDEMCIDFVNYYPFQKSFSECGYKMCGLMSQKPHPITATELEAFTEWPRQCNSTDQSNGHDD